MVALPQPLMFLWPLEEKSRKIEFACYLFFFLFNLFTLLKLQIRGEGANLPDDIPATLSIGVQKWRAVIASRKKAIAFLHL